MLFKITCEAYSLLTQQSSGITVLFASPSQQGPLKSQQSFLVLLMRDLWWDFFSQNMDPSDYYLFAKQMEKKSTKNNCLSSYEDMKHYYGLKWFQDPLDSPFSSSSIAGKELNRERLGRIACSENVVSFFDTRIFIPKSQQDTNGNWVPKCLCKSKWNCK